MANENPVECVEFQFQVFGLNWHHLKFLMNFIENYSEAQGAEVHGTYEDMSEQPPGHVAELGFFGHKLDIT